MSEIDVSKCAGYCSGICYIEEYGGATDVYCERNKNCYYKQLQQLKQENEELKEKLGYIEEVLQKANNVLNNICELVEDNYEC